MYIYVYVYSVYRIFQVENIPGIEYACMCICRNENNPLVELAKVNVPPCIAFEKKTLALAKANIPKASAL